MCIPVGAPAVTAAAAVEDDDAPAAAVSASFISASAAAAVDVEAAAAVSAAAGDGFGPLSVFCCLAVRFSCKIGCDSWVEVICQSAQTCEQGVLHTVTYACQEYHAYLGSNILTTARS